MAEVIRPDCASRPPHPGPPPLCKHHYPVKLSVLEPCSILPIQNTPHLRQHHYSLPPSLPPSLHPGEDVGRCSLSELWYPQYNGTVTGALRSGRAVSHSFDRGLCLCHCVGAPLSSFWIRVRGIGCRAMVL